MSPCPSTSPTRPSRPSAWSGSSRSSTSSRATWSMPPPSCSTSVSSRHGPEPRIHKELLRNTVELTTGICRTTDEAMTELAGLIELVRPFADELGVDLYSAGTHPFAAWSHQLLTPGHRYEELIARTQWWGRQMLIWGVHVHVGVPRDHAMPIVSSLLKWYPHLQALSASSPIWAGTDTGYASNRAMMFQQLPTAGLPFQFDTWADFEAYAHDLQVTGVIEEIDEIRWDVRPAPKLGHRRGADLRRRLHAQRDACAGGAHPLPRRRPLRPALPRRDLADDAAVARAGEQVACRPLRPGRVDHPRRALQRVPDAGGPGRPPRAPRARRRTARLHR